mgnify:CR=1 FL=1
MSTPTVVLDTETTGLDAPIGVVELAHVFINDEMEVLSEHCCLVNPGRPIDPGATDIHGIKDEHVVGHPPLERAIAPLTALPEIIVIGHNIPFDLRLVGPHLNVVGTVCTLALSRQYFPKAPNHRLSTMQEYLGLPDFEAHRALGDVITALNVLRRILVGHGLTLQQVVQRQAKPRMLSVMPWGKHAGKPLIQVPSDYRRWLLAQGNLDQDMRYTLTQLEKL